MKFETSNIVAAGAVAVAVIGFAWGVCMNNNYNNEKRTRNDEAIITKIHAAWADFCIPEIDGEGAAAAKHAELDAMLNKHEWFTEIMEKSAHELNAHYLNINL